MTTEKELYAELQKYNKELESQLDSVDILSSETSNSKKLDSSKDISNSKIVRAMSKLQEQILFQNEVFMKNLLLENQKANQKLFEKFFSELNEVKTQISYLSKYEEEIQTLKESIIDFQNQTSFVNQALSHFKAGNDTNFAKVYHVLEKIHDRFQARFQTVDNNLELLSQKVEHFDMDFKEETNQIDETLISQNEILDNENKILEKSLLEIQNSQISTTSNQIKTAPSHKTKPLIQTSNDKILDVEKRLERLNSML